jgi:hypothetical protein
MSYEYNGANSHVKSCYKNLDSYTGPASNSVGYRGIRAPVPVSLSNSMYNDVKAYNISKLASMGASNTRIQDRDFQLGFNDITRK